MSGAKVTLEQGAVDNRETVRYVEQKHSSCFPKKNHLFLFLKKNQVSPDRTQSTAWLEDGQHPTVLRKISERLDFATKLQVLKFN